MFKKPQLLGSLVAVLLVGLLFSLPKSVVDNGEKKEASAQEGSALASEDPDDHEGHDHPPGEHDHSHEADMHLAELAPEKRQIADQLREKLAESENKENIAIFADSLALLYAQSLKYDSAAYYAEQAVGAHESLPRIYSAGLYNFEAFNFATDGQRQAAFGKKAEGYLLKVLEQDPEGLEPKNKLAMLYVASENPMKGIVMLREVLEKDADNKEALMNMGLLSVRSNQYDKAAERFEHLTRLEPGNVQAQFYLALSYLETGKKELAKERFLKVKELDKDPEVVATVGQYLKNL